VHDELDVVGRADEVQPPLREHEIVSAHVVGVARPVRLLDDPADAVEHTGRHCPRRDDVPIA
jgi:hypothetical protein